MYYESKMYFKIPQPESQLYTTTMLMKMRSFNNRKLASVSLQDSFLPQ